MVKASSISPRSPKKAKGLKGFLKQFRECTKRPQLFLTTQKEIAEQVKSLVKGLYDYGTKNEFSEQNGTASVTSYLDELVTDEMDAEQIWQQLDLKNTCVVEQGLENISSILSKNEKALLLDFTTGTGDDDQDDASGHESDQQDQEDEENGERKITKARKKSTKAKKSNGEKKGKPKRSVVDDQFFRLDDMARFLDEEDDRERRRQNGLAEKDSLMEIDYFDENTGKDDEDDEEGELKYADFFDDDDDDDGDEDEDDDGDSEDGDEDDLDREMSGEEDEDGEDNDKNGAQEEEEELTDEEEMERNRRLRYEIYKGESGIPYEAEKRSQATKLIAEPSDESEPENVGDGQKSSHELRQEKFLQKVSRMEEQMLKAKPWQLMGETTADSRPQNSLLEEVLQFENTTRTAPVISEETTMKLEDIIRQRIKNKAFDDVERKVRPPENPREYRKQLVLDGEKSKESLAQVYEADYLKQLEKSNPDAADQTVEEEEPKEHKEIRRMMKSLMAQLDALSNFHFTPRPAVPELKILTNTAAISMEEVAPVAVSDANLLAPEEVHRRPKGDVMSKEERTKTDQNRERRLKKRFQQEKFRREAEREQKQLAKANAGMATSAKESRELQASLMKKVTKAKNVQQMAETSSGGASKSSSAFFSRLQDEVRSQVKAKANGASKKKRPAADTLQAASMKL
ncbi:U3 small nucleolar ribonucleoprotein protein MPP10 [Anopheles darlingi]|uniref:U3 small nucleolar ribonucleoprotein protein MPP10 n=1 Tax=Anopheles darlingi TaxID=43151 RepID=UPI0021002C9E|nr:U3 small nucleolar ribonucleoprotein protein MPP10 [Anopheles darlingi]